MEYAAVRKLQDDLYKEAMEAYKNSETRLHSNIKMHRDRYMLRHRGRMAASSAENSVEAQED